MKKVKLSENQMYASPSVEVLEVISSTVLAASAAFINENDIDSWQNGNNEWFN